MIRFTALYTKMELIGNLQTKYWRTQWILVTMISYIHAYNVFEKEIVLIITTTYPRNYTSF